MSAAKTVRGDPAAPNGRWSSRPSAYDAKARELAVMFRENFELRFAAGADDAVAAAGPR